MTTLKVADLDANLMYWGMKDKPAEELQAGDVVFKAETLRDDRVEGVTYLHGECDLPAGRYRWNPSSNAFDVAGKFALQTPPATPLAEGALLDVVRALEADGKALPYALTWAKWYQSTLDGRG